MMYCGKTKNKSQSMTFMLVGFLFIFFLVENEKRLFLKTKILIYCFY